MGKVPPRKANPLKVGRVYSMVESKIVEKDGLEAGEGT